MLEGVRGDQPSATFANMEGCFQDLKDTLVRQGLVHEPNCFAHLSLCIVAPENDGAEPGVANVALTGDESIVEALGRAVHASQSIFSLRLHILDTRRAFAQPAAPPIFFPNGLQQPAPNLMLNGSVSDWRGVQTNRTGSGPNSNQSPSSPGQGLSFETASGRREFIHLQEIRAMLNEKMILDPIVSMVLFNEYIPLGVRRDEPEEAKAVSSLSADMANLAVTPPAEAAVQTKGLFIRSELPPTPMQPNKESHGGLFIRTGEVPKSKAPSVDDDWVLA